jgi:hypothetical protein
MPCFLQDLKVKKVSFVRRGANKKQFFLAKSADFVEKKIINEHSLGGTITVRPEIKAKVAEILKMERNAEKVVSLLREDTVLKATDIELEEISSFVSMIPAPPIVDNSALAKAQADIDLANAKALAAETRVSALETIQHTNDLSAWLAKECPALNIPSSSAIAQVLNAEKVSKEAAELLKDSFKSISTALQSSSLFREAGVRGDNGDVLGADLVKAAQQKLTEIQKSGAATKGSEQVVAAIRSLDVHKSEQYIADFRRKNRAAGADQAS